MTLTFNKLTDVSITRAERWHKTFHNGQWTGADWSNAMQGEAGEAGNIVKKLRRIECGLSGRDGEEAYALHEKLALELADTVMYTILLAAYYRIDIEQAIITKFNLVSEEMGFPDRL